MLSQTTTKETISSNQIVQATREDLFSLLSFLDRQLPQNCPIHSFVLFAIQSRNPTYKVYFVKNDFDSTVGYTAILGLRNEHSLDSQKVLQKSWIISVWQESDPHQVCEIFNAITEINWSQDRLIWFGNGEVPNLVVLKHLEQNKATKLEPDHGSPCFQYYLPIEEAITQQLDMPREVYVKSLEQKHAAVVYENWPYRETTTIEDVTIGIDQLPSAGVFLKENDQLVSWMMSFPPNGMSRLHTLDEHRRKGYAKLLTQYLSKRVAQSGCVPFVNIVQNNAASVALFESMSFRLLCRRFVYLSHQISYDC